MKGLLIIGICLLIFLPDVSGQPGVRVPTDFHLPPAPTQAQNSPFQFSTGNGLHFPHNPSIFPEYVKNNPQGFSYLCRLELAVEEKLPVGVWIKLDEGDRLGTPAYHRAYLRFKLFDF